MARKTIRQKLKALERRYPFRNRAGFLYQHKRDLRAKYSRIMVYSLIYDPKKGHSVFAFDPHRRGNNWTYLGWNRWLNDRGLTIISSDVIEAMNAKNGTNWQFRRLIGFHGVLGENVDVVHERKNRNKRARGN